MFSRLKTLLGVLQTSHYDAALFRAWIRRHPGPVDWDEFRARVVVDWTWKARILFWKSITVSRLLPLSLRMNLFFLRPFEWFATRWIAVSAARRMRKFEFRAIIGITGSFGKTTTKEILAHVLGQKFHVHKTPENVNTLLGVSAWIKKKEFQDGDILVVEMGAYRKGDIAALCNIVRPTVGILTGLNEAHRERFGSLEQTAAAKCELIDALPSGGIALWNADSELLRTAVEARLTSWGKGGIQSIPYGRKGNGNTGFFCESAGESGLLVRIGQNANKSSIHQDNNIPTYLRMLVCQIPFLGEHVCQELAVAVTLGNLLGMSQEEIVKGCQAVRLLPRRLAPTLAHGDRLIIDDSYNITLDGAGAALEALARIHRRKIGVFAGIPEGGEESDRINKELGRKIAPAFEIILLGDTPVAEAVLRGLIEVGFNESQIIRYTDGKEVESILARVAKDNDCIYFSAYDWPPIYL